ncbi:unnamed protein product, partial [Caretta caretta]
MLPSWALAPISRLAGRSQYKREASCVVSSPLSPRTGLHGHSRASPRDSVTGCDIGAALPCRPPDAKTRTRFS